MTKTKILGFTLIRLNLSCARSRFKKLWAEKGLKTNQNYFTGIVKMFGSSSNTFVVSPSFLIFYLLYVIPIFLLWVSANLLHLSIISSFLCMFFYISCLQFILSLRNVRFSIRTFFLHLFFPVQAYSTCFSFSVYYYYISFVVLLSFFFLPFYEYECFRISFYLCQCLLHSRLLH